jgi:hypothetical protein
MYHSKNQECRKLTAKDLPIRKTDDIFIADYIRGTANLNKAFIQSSAGINNQLCYYITHYFKNSVCQYLEGKSEARRIDKRCLGSMG